MLWNYALFCFILPNLAHSCWLYASFTHFGLLLPVIPIFVIILCFSLSLPFHEWNWQIYAWFFILIILQNDQMGQKGQRVQWVGLLDSWIRKARWVSHVWHVRWVEVAKWGRSWNGLYLVDEREGSDWSYEPEGSSNDSDGHEEGRHQLCLQRRNMHLQWLWVLIEVWWRVRCFR